MLREVGKRSGRRLPISWNATLLVFLVRRFVMLSSIIRNRAAIFSKEEITWIQRPSLYFVNGRKTYNTESFIKDDPLRFPHRFTEKRDIEISVFLTAWISLRSQGAYSPKSGRATPADGRKSLRVYPYRRDFFRSPTEPPGLRAGYLLPFLYLS